MQDRISYKDKMMFIPKPNNLICLIHFAPALFYCSKNTCQQYTYLCERCRRDNTHNHVDQIYDYLGWVQKMTEKITSLRNPNNRIFQSVYSQAGKGDFKRYVSELRRVLQLVQNLEVRVSEMVRESKMKIIGYIRKYQTYGQSKLSTKGYLYANPYLFASKVNSERNDEFVQDIKKCFKGDSAELIDGFNPKYEVINLQGRLKKLLQGSNSDLFNLSKETIVKSPIIQPYQQRILSFDNKPEKLFMKGDHLILGFKSQTQIFRVSTCSIEERLAVNISKCSSLIVDNSINFIGISQNSNKDLITFVDKKVGSFSFEFKLYAILLYYDNHKYYAIIGRDQGKITIFDIQTSQILATLQEAHNSKVQFLQPWENEMKIVSCGRNTAISIYKISHLVDQVSLQFQQQLVMNVGEIKQFQVYGTYLIALLQGRNIIVHDLVLKVQYRNITNEPCKEFDMISLLSDSETHLIFATHSQSENHLCLWFVEKKKPQAIRCERLLFFEKEESSIIQMNANDTWLIRPQQNQRKIYNFNLQVV